MEHTRICFVKEPKKISLPFPTSNLDAPEQLIETVTSFRKAVEEYLFTWESFPIELPESISSVSNTPIANLFNAPEFDECQQLAKDALGNSKPLTHLQLHQLRRTGDFDVESFNFPGEAHTWKISQFLLKGTNNIYATLKSDFYHALSYFVIVAVDLICGNRFSIWNGICATYTHVLRPFIDLLFGWPFINYGDVENKLLEERLRFITCELSVKSSHRKRVMNFWDSFENFMSLSRDVPVEVPADCKHPPYQFITPSRISIDLRLHNSTLLERCLAIVHELRQPARAGWFQDFKEQQIAKFRDEGKSIGEIKRLVRQECLQEYARRLFDAMRASEALSAINQGIAEPLIHQATFNLFLVEAKEAFTNAWLSYRAAADSRLHTRHPLLYNIEKWRSRRMAEIQKQYFELHKFDVHEFVLSKCSEAGLDQHAFFIRRDFLFLKEREKLLRNQLGKSSSFPDTQFIFKIPAQLIQYWRVYRKPAAYSTNYELVDTVLMRDNSSNSGAVAPTLEVKRAVKQKLCPRKVTGDYQPLYPRNAPAMDKDLGPQDFDVHSVTPSISKRATRSTNDVLHDEVMNVTESADPSHRSKSTEPLAEYIVQSNLVYKVSTRNFLWRWVAFFVCTYCWLLRLGQLFFITIPFRSAFSLTVLIQPSPIYLKLEIDQVSGYLFYNKAFFQDTLTSRLRRMWSDIRKSRIAFDAAPSRGIIDKTAARPLHRIWSYFFRGVCLSILIVLVWPPLCLLISISSLTFGVLLPVLIPPGSLLLHLLGLFFWDAYKPASKNNRLFPVFELVFVQLFLRVLCQTLLSTLTAFIICPLLAVFNLLFGVGRFVLRSVLDFLVFHCVIRPLARIPSTEDRLVRRIAGPGTTENQFYQARPVDVLIILTGQFELLELRLWRRQMESLANKPLETYNNVVRGLSWLSVSHQSDGSVYSHLCRMTKSWRASIQNKTDERSCMLQIDLKPNQLQCIKLTDRDLRLTLRMGGELSECFYRTRILPRIQLLDQSTSEWWSEFSLGSDDFLGLFTSLLSKTFGEQIFRCISETDTVFPLQFHAPRGSRSFQAYMHYLVTSASSNAGNAANSASGTVALQPNDGTVRDGELIPTLEGEVVSVSSDVAMSSMEITSKRCTVIPAVNTTSASGEIAKYTIQGDHGVDLTPTSELETNVSWFDLSANKRNATHHRPVPDPIAYIHVDLPLFPLSTFTPSSHRQLPLPLRSHPRPPNAFPICNHPWQKYMKYLDYKLRWLICSTRTRFDRSLKQKLIAECHEHVPNSGEVNDRVASECQAGLSTLLAEEEYELRRQFSGLSVNKAGVARSGFRHRHRHVKPDDAIDLLSSAHCSTRSVFRHDQLLLLDEFDPINNRVEFAAVYNIVEHLGRVYHPAIITLLMHSRDREHCPLDLSHPVIQTAVSQITMPPNEFTLLMHIRQRTDFNHLTLRDFNIYPYPNRDIALSKIDLRCHTPSLSRHRQQQRNRGTYSFKVVPDEGLENQNTRKVVSVHAFDSKRITDSVLVQTGAILNCKAKNEQPQNKQYLGDTSLEMSHDRDQPAVDLNTFVDWSIENASLAPPNWPSVDARHVEQNGREGSAGTPTCSLYGTEDAATTDDLDDSDDVLSLPSVSHDELLDTFFINSNPTNMPNGTNGAATRPQCLPLVVPELLTTSATTVDSSTEGDTHRESSEFADLLATSGLEFHRDQHSTATNSLITVANVTSSGATSTAVTPGSCEVLPIGSPESVRADINSMASVTTSGKPAGSNGEPKSSLNEPRNGVSTSMVTNADVEPSSCLIAPDSTVPDVDDIAVNVFSSEGEKS